jgi:hypothetical protein
MAHGQSPNEAIGKVEALACDCGSGRTRPSMNILTRRKALLGASALLCAPAIRGSRAATSWYVQPPPLLQATRDGGVFVLPTPMQRDRIIGSRTRASTQAGTVFDFTRVTDGAGAAYAKFDDPTYQALIAANPTIFADCTVTNSINQETADTTLIDEENWDTHPQLCVMMGDSLMDSTAGFTVHPELALPQNQCWAQPVASKPTPYTATPDSRASGTGPPIPPMRRVHVRASAGNLRTAAGGSQRSQAGPIRVRPGPGQISKPICNAFRWRPISSLSSSFRLGPTISTRRTAFCSTAGPNSVGPT